MKSLLVISSYPAKGFTHHKKTVGIASYAKNTLIGLKKTSPNLKITVLAEKFDNRSENYIEPEANVKRVWKRGSFLSFPLLFFEILKHNDTKQILFEFEISMFGNSLKTAPLPFFLFLLRLFDKNVTIVLHQVILDFSEFEGHTNIKGLRSQIFSLFSKVFYFLVVRTAKKVIVFEDELKKRLGGGQKVKVIVHGVEKFDTKITKDGARKTLKIAENKKVILLFGYIAWYKGTDWIVEQFNKLRQDPKFKKYLLIIAGGPNPNHTGKKFYMDYLSEVKRLSTENIRYEGFIPENEIANYFTASDAVILPYRAFMSASGPLSIAYSFEKPAFLSVPLSPVVNGFKDKKDLIFDLTDNSFKNLMERINNPKFLSKVALISKELKNKRSFENIAKHYLDVIFYGK